MGEVNEALLESNNLLQEEVSRVRNNNRMLRAVISALRQTNSELRRSVEIAVANDDAFKAMCQESVPDFRSMGQDPVSYNAVVQGSADGLSVGPYTVELPTV